MNYIFRKPTVIMSMEHTNTSKTIIEESTSSNIRISRCWVYVDGYLNNKFCSTICYYCSDKFNLKS